MKFLFLVAALLMHIFVLDAQTTVTTITSGNFNNPAIWSNGVVPGANCNCIVQIRPNEKVTISSPVVISDVAIQLTGSASEIGFQGTNDLTLNGPASIDIQNPNARIFSNNQNNQIILAGTEIFKGNNTKVNSTVAGEVKGPASASSQRTDVHFINSTLPVKLNVFQATVNNNKALLSWTTAAEINAEIFQVERSQDSRLWNNIGSVQAAGNTSTDHEYTYTDALPANGMNYYRLKMIDRDASFEYSAVRNVNVSTDGWTISTTPNPVTTSLNISVNQPGQATYRVKMYNHSGQTVYDRQHGGHTQRITIGTSNYAEGMYVVEVSSAEGLHQVKKIIISRK